MAGQNSLIPKDSFVGLAPPTVHLAVGGEAPPLKASTAAVKEFFARKAAGRAGRSAFVADYQLTKRSVASFLGVPEEPSRIAFIGSAAEGLNLLASSMEWRPGDNVVTLEGEYPSSFLPWLARRADGVRLVAVQPGEHPEDAIAAAVTKATRIVCVSHVSYLHGRRLDLAALRRIADDCGALLAVDASHSLGVLPVPIEHCDVLVSCCYKFLLGVHGAAVLYWMDRAQPHQVPGWVGWHSIEWPHVEDRSHTYRLKDGVERFEVGNPSFISVVALQEAIKTLGGISTDDLQAHVGALRSMLHEGLEDLGFRMWSPPDYPEASANVVFGSEHADAIVRWLEAQNILAWSGDGRVRFSLHGYNDCADVAHVLTALRALPSGLR